MWAISYWLWAARWRFHTPLKLWSFSESVCLLKFVLKGKSMSKIIRIMLLPSLLSAVRHIYQLHEKTYFYTLSTFPDLLVLQSKYFRGQTAGFGLSWTPSGTFPWGLPMKTRQSSGEGPVFWLVDEVPKKQTFLCGGSGRMRLSFSSVNIQHEKKNIFLSGNNFLFPAVDNSKSQHFENTGGVYGLIYMPGLDSTAQ